MSIDHIISMRASGFPALLLAGLPNPEIDMISVNDRTGAYKLTRYLFSLARRRIGFVDTGPSQGNFRTTREVYLVGGRDAVALSSRLAVQVLSRESVSPSGTPQAQRVESDDVSVGGLYIHKIRFNAGKDRSSPLEGFGRSNFLRYWADVHGGNQIVDMAHAGGTDGQTDNAVPEQPHLSRLTS